MCVDIFYVLFLHYLKRKWKLGNHKQYFLRKIVVMASEAKAVPLQAMEAIKGEEV
jgi:hypothetical protein